MSAATLAKLRIVPFTVADQDQVKRLILLGLGQRWGWDAPDETLNPDLNDIATSYANGIFLVAKLDATVVATGALLPRSRGLGELVRMSVDSPLRRHGIATRLLHDLLARAPQLGVQRVVLETSASWHETIAFYVANGFTITHTAEGPFGAETWFALEIE
jgi:GNAT superfamily N-acetyltransferase